MEDIKQDIQHATSDYLINTPTPHKNLLDTADETIIYIKTFLQPNYSYPKPLTASIIQFPYPNTQYHITPDIMAEERATTSATNTAPAPNTSIPTNTL